MRAKRRALAEPRFMALIAAALMIPVSLQAASTIPAAPAASAAVAIPQGPPAGTSLSQTLDKLVPSPKQTIALRDFLGAHIDRPVPLGQQPNGLFLFELRDAKNIRTGQIAVGADTSEASIFVARISGPAAFDMSRRSQTPRLVNAKMRDGISALLTATLAGPAFESATAKSRDLFLRERPMLAIAADPVTGPDRIIEAEASFFADGSGYYRTMRAPVGSTAPIHLAAKYYPAIDADGKHAFRSSVIGIDADLTATLVGFGNKPVCPIAGCGSIQPTPAVTLAGDIHLTRWPHAVVPSAPQNLITQITPPPPPAPVELSPQQQPPQDAGDPAH